MNNRASHLKICLLLGGVLYLCGLSFVIGRSSAQVVKPAVRATHDMNELDRLQQETAHRR